MDVLVAHGRGIGGMPWLAGRAGKLVHQKAELALYLGGQIVRIVDHPGELELADTTPTSWQKRCMAAFSVW